MKNVIVGIFAHPDDEAFGPGGTLALLAKTHDVYVICATKGEAGGLPSQSKDEIANLRENELLKAAEILGIKEVRFLGFEDGTLSNNTYHAIADKVQQHLAELKPDTIITFEPRGVSGHIDHIAMSMITTFVFYKLDFIKRLYYFCISDREKNATEKAFGSYFVYFPPGYSKKEIDKTFNVESVWETKVRAMQAHTSQISDVNRILSVKNTLPKEEYFLILEK
jgi:LmbE family N-acetylglucosaminyl deacetylase